MKRATTTLTRTGIVARWIRLARAAGRRFESAHPQFGLLYRNRLARDGDPEWPIERIGHYRADTAWGVFIGWDGK